MSKEIKEKGNTFPPFKEAVKDFSIDEIYKLAEATYLLQVSRTGGVIDE